MDLASGEVRPNQVFADWVRIVAILSPTTDATDVWEIVSEHVRALVDCAPKTDPIHLPPPEDPSDAALVEKQLSSFTANYLDHPAYAVAQGAQQFFLDRIVAGDLNAETVLAARLRDLSAPHHGSLLVARATALAADQIPNCVVDALRSLKNAASYPDRLTALALLEAEDNVGAQRPSQRTTHALVKPLPPAFSVLHPPQTPSPSSKPAGDLDSEAEADAADILWLFGPELELVASWAQVQPQQLARYVTELANSLVTQKCAYSVFSTNEEVRGALLRMGLRIPYRKPAPRRVEHALECAVAMLVDHGRLDDRHTTALETLFRKADPYFLTSRPVRRPLIVRPIPERSQSNHVGPSWTSGASTSDAQLAHVEPLSDSDSPTDEDKEWVVIAEDTSLRWLDWKYAVETRLGVRSKGHRASEHDSEPPDPTDADGGAAANKAIDARVATFSNLTANQYLTHARAQTSMVVRNRCHRYETPARTWLALNPSLGLQLNWKLSEDGLFRWVDRHGAVMAESVWWQDGFLGQLPPQFDDEVGEGWLVRASADGWRQIRGSIPQWTDWCRVARLANEQPPRSTEQNISGP